MKIRLSDLCLNNMLPIKNRLLYFSLFISLLLSQAHAAQAPDIRIQTGKQSLQLKDFRGTVIYLDFWASWCIPCRESFPWMNKIEQQYSKKGFKVIAVNLDENRSQADAFLKKYPAQFTVGFDASGDSAEAFNVKGMPSSYLIDRRGNILSSHIGFRQKEIEQLESAIRAALAQQEAM